MAFVGRPPPRSDRGPSRSGAYSAFRHGAGSLAPAPDRRSGADPARRQGAGSLIPAPCRRSVPAPRRRSGAPAPVPATVQQRGTKDRLISLSWAAITAQQRARTGRRCSAGQGDQKSDSERARAMDPHASLPWVPMLPCLRSLPPCYASLIIPRTHPSPVGAQARQLKPTTKMPQTDYRSSPHNVETRPEIGRDDG